MSVVNYFLPFRSTSDLFLICICVRFKTVPGELFCLFSCPHCIYFLSISFCLLYTLCFPSFLCVVGVFRTYFKGISGSSEFYLVFLFTFLLLSLPLYYFVFSAYIACYFSMHFNQISHRREFFFDYQNVNVPFPPLSFLFLFPIYHVLCTFLYTLGAIFYTLQ